MNGISLGRRKDSAFLIERTKGIRQGLDKMENDHELTFVKGDPAGAKVPSSTNRFLRHEQTRALIQRTVADYFRFMVDRTLGCSCANSVLRVTTKVVGPSSSQSKLPHRRLFGHCVLRCLSIVSTTSAQNLRCLRPIPHLC
jgi:hypothetical protein